MANETAKSVQFHEDSPTPETDSRLVSEAGKGEHRSHNRGYSSIVAAKDREEAENEHELQEFLQHEAFTPRFEDSLLDDMRNFREGSIPQSLTLAFANAIACGIGSFLYYIAMTSLIEFFWHTLPNTCAIDEIWPEWARALWIPLIVIPMAICLGLSVVILGEPGDLAYTVQCVHNEGFVHLSHVVPMCVASLFSIVGGGSVGPEAPLVAICAAIGGNISKHIFRQRKRNVLRKHTLMGMSGGLAAFFGCPLGGSIFALEVCSKFGIEYFEHLIEAILCGLLTMCVFRTLTGLEIGPVWSSPTPPLPYATPILIGNSILIGLAGAAVGAFFVALHWRVISVFEWLDLLDNKRAVWRALLGAVVISIVGMLIPHTLFWGEAEFQTIYTLSPAATLEHVYPTGGLIGFEMNTFWNCIIVGLCKLLTISFSVAGGYRGGFIFPLFASGCAFGRATLFLFPSLSPTVTCLSFAAGVNVAITKTSIATTLILAYLSGEQNAIAAILAASLASLFATSYMPFIKTQIDREEEAATRVIKLLRKPAEEEARERPKRMISMRTLTRAMIGMGVPSRQPQQEVPLRDIRQSFRHHTKRGYIV